MKGIQVRWPRRPWNRATLPIQRPGNTALIWLWICTLKWGVPLVVRERMWIQHDGAPSHVSVDVRNHLSAVFPGRWIGREALFHGMRGHLTFIPFIIFYGNITKVSCVWDGICGMTDIVVLVGLFNLLEDGYASPSNPVTRKYSTEMVADIHTEVRLCTFMLYPHPLTNSQGYTSLLCGCPQPFQCCISWSLD